MEAISEHDRVYKLASDMVYPLIEIHGRRSVELDAEATEKLRRGIQMYDQVIVMNPRNYAAMWLAGKCYQRLKELEAAYKMFVRANAIVPGQPDVAREAAIMAMELGRPADAVGFCERAIQASPDDAGLRANLALALLFSGQVDAAHVVAENALLEDPSDEITARIVGLCREVKEGKRGCPRHASEI